MRVKLLPPVEWHSLIFDKYSYMFHIEKINTLPLVLSTNSIGNQCTSELHLLLNQNFICKSCPKENDYQCEFDLKLTNVIFLQKLEEEKLQYEADLKTKEDLLRAIEQDGEAQAEEMGRMEQALAEKDRIIQ